MSTHETVTSEVVMLHPRAGPEPFAILPSFPRLMTRIDAFARRVPWYLWVGGTMAALWWLNRRKGKTFKLLGGG